MKEETITLEELAEAHERINKMLHRSDCQNHDTDDCFGCKLAECYESIRELISELKFNPQRDDEDKQQIDSVIEKAKRKLPEFRGMRFDNHYIGGAK
jgi:hypothetical protein